MQVQCKIVLVIHVQELKKHIHMPISKSRTFFLGRQTWSIRNFAAFSGDFQQTGTREWN